MPQSFHGEETFEDLGTGCILFLINFYRLLPDESGGVCSTLQQADITINLRSFAEALLPIGASKYWFATDYLILMLLSPILNILLESLSRRQLLKGLLVATFFWSVMPTFVIAKYDGSNLIWFFVLYLYAGYVRYYVDLEKPGEKNLLLCILFYVLVIASAVCMIWVGHKIGMDELISGSDQFSRLTSTFILVSGLELLIGTVRCKAFTSKVINRISSATFGVYLIHDNTWARWLIWKYLLGLPDSMYGSSYFLLLTFASVLAVFAVCAVIDILRQCTIEKLYLKLVDRILQRYGETFGRLKGRILDVAERLMN